MVFIIMYSPSQNLSDKPTSLLWTNYKRYTSLERNVLTQRKILIKTEKNSDIIHCMMLWYIFFHFHTVLVLLKQIKTCVQLQSIYTQHLQITDRSLNTDIMPKLRFMDAEFRLTWLKWNHGQFEF